MKEVWINNDKFSFYNYDIFKNFKKLTPQMSQSIDRLLKKIEENVDKEIDVMALELNFSILLTI